MFFLRALCTLALAAVGALLSVHAAGTSAPSPPVNVRLRTSWAAPPLLLEILESAYAEDEHSFLPLLTNLTSPSTAPYALTDAQLYSKALSALSADDLRFDPVTIDAFKVSLSLHAVNPKIEAFYQFYDTSVNASLDGFTTEDGERVGEGDCRTWAEWDGMAFCSPKELEQAVAGQGRGAKLPKDSAKLLPFDHIEPAPLPTLPSPTSPSLIILYGDPLMPKFHDFHLSALSLVSKDASLHYVLRYVPPESHHDIRAPRNVLTGYGAALDLKKVDYLVIDDRKLKDGVIDHEVEGAADTHKDLRQALLFDDEPLEGEEQLSLTDEDLRDIGIKAASLLKRSPDPLANLVDLSQNFPRHAISLARRTRVDKDVRDEIVRIQALADGGAPVKLIGGQHSFWLNGKKIDEKELDPFKLLSHLRGERNLVSSLISLGLSPREAVHLLSEEDIGNAHSADDPLEGMFDASDRIEGGGAITWWNDLENDSRYRRWSSGLGTLLRPPLPGPFHSIRQNIFNVVFALDLSSRKSCRFIAETVAQNVQRGMGVHFGIVPIGLDDPEARRAARLFWYLLGSHGELETARFLSRLGYARTPSPRVDVSLIRSELERLLLHSPASPASPRGAKEDRSEAQRGEVARKEVDKLMEEVITTEDVSEKEIKAKAYTKRLGVDLPSNPNGFMFVNGKPFPLTDNWPMSLQQSLLQQTNHLQRKVFEGVLQDSSNASTYFYDLPTTYVRRSSVVFPDSEANPLKVLNLVAAFKHLDDEGNKLTQRFVYKDDESRPEMTVWVIGDMDSPGGATVLRETLSAMEDDKFPFQFRVGIVHQPSSSASLPTRSRSSLSSHIFKLLVSPTAAPTLRPSDLRNHPALSGDSHQDSTTETSEQVVFQEATDSDDVQAERFWQSYGRKFAGVIGIREGNVGFLVNGRVLDSVDPEDWSVHDFEALLAYETNKRVRPVLGALERVYPDPKVFDRDNWCRLATLVSSVVAEAYEPPKPGLFILPALSRNRAYEKIEANHTAFELGNPETALFHCTFVVDPLSELVQKWSSIMQLLAGMERTYVKVILNPTPNHTDHPIKRFYRFHARPQLEFLESGSEKPATISFVGMPEDAVLTLGLETPAPWLVMPEEAIYDLDNIRLKDLDEGARKVGVNAVYELKHVLVEGHARDVVKKEVPRGMELILATKDHSHVLDTIVKANLGYFQFKANPGLWQLHIRGQGVSRAVYELESVGNQGWESPPINVTGHDVTVTSFEGLTIYPRFTRKAGMEEADVLEIAKTDDFSPKGLANKVMSLFSSLTGGKDNKAAPEAVASGKKADINVFTIASGHLYERMTYIMILSVLRNTKSSVKFWFIENFLSPSFKAFIPRLAAEYGFDYELITYAWPHWLRAQKEKQRTIWAYKILFLDVLFPLGLDKVIFVDADQVVRADLKELVDLDLKGAPYAYPPMGDDREEMEGFRFWKTGYWQQFLRGRPYHISALYVVDLDRFRKIAAGDRLRGQYQALSADPNSLANLDQDLPNNMQFQIPIRTLDKSWLWCETWCSDESLKDAKTIDLCSNPKTHEPKLDRARRQVAEWTELDDEVAALARRVAEAEEQKRNEARLTSMPSTNHTPSATGSGAHDEL